MSTTGATTATNDRKRKQHEETATAVPSKKKVKHVSANSLRALTSEQKRERIEKGLATFRGRRFYGSGFKLVVANDCVIVGNNNNVRGHNNILYGEHNTTDGTNNLCKKREELDRDRIPMAGDPREPVVPPPTPATTSAPIGDPLSSNLHQLHLLSFATSPNSFVHIWAGDDDDDSELEQQRRFAPPPLNPVDAAATSTLMQQTPDSKWKASVMDLPGQAQPCELAATHDGDEECKLKSVHCAICDENRFDTVTEPCHHLLCCRNCLREMYQKTREARCPKCRALIKYSSIIF